MLELILLKKQTPSLFNSAGPYDGFHELGEGIIDVSSLPRIGYPVKRAEILDISTLFSVVTGHISSSLPLLLNNFSV